jgi:hypothetical protein
MFNPKTECSGAQCALLLHPAAHSTVNWAKSTWDGGATESYMITIILLVDIGDIDITDNAEGHCREPAISLYSYTVPLVQWSTRLLPVMRDTGLIPGGVLV